ncbi:MAG: hypothetical protein SGJ07_13945 [Rhodospirillaceae bacterium]|nr:hypothetical protein [Rhodospirillaceae bacterium]
MARFLALEQPLCVLRQFENLHAFVHVRLLSGLMPVDLALQAQLLLAPLAGEAVVEVAADLPVELVDVHRIDTLAEALVLGPQPFDRSLVLAPLVGVAGLKRLAHPAQHLVVEAQPAEQFRKPFLQHFLAHALGTGRLPAFGFGGVAGAVIVDVALLLDLAHDRAAARAAGDQT